MHWSINTPNVAFCILVYQISLDNNICSGDGVMDLCTVKFILFAFVIIEFKTLSHFNLYI